eukprot:PITA_18524
MLRAYVMQQPTKWEDYLHLVEFTYNNGHHTSLLMSPFEVLYGRKCHTPSSWSGPNDRLMLGSEMLKEMEELVKRVEPEGEIRVELLSILNQREVTLRKRDITQVKVQWQHFGPDESTWEDEEFMKRAYPRREIDDMRRARSASHKCVVGQGPAENNPELWVPLGEEARNTNLAILETVQELLNEMARLREDNARRKCHTPSSFSGPEDRLLLGPEMIKEMEELVKRVEPKGEIQVELLSTLNWREVTLQKWDITQVKVQWQHFGPDEATWEDK